MSSDSELVNIILQEIVENKIKTQFELEQEIKSSLYQLYHKFLQFDANQDNFRDTFAKLKGYKYVEFTDLEEGRFIRYLSNKYFYDIKLQKGGFIAGINYPNKKIKLINQNKIFYLDATQVIIYMKLNEEEMVKQQIIESI